MIESPSGRSPEKAPRWDLVFLELAAAGIVFHGRFCWFGNIWEFIGEGGRSGDSRGAHKLGGTPLGHGLLARGLLGDLLSSSPSPSGVFWYKKNHRESFIPFGLRLIFLLSETQKQGKNRNWHLALD